MLSPDGKTLYFSRQNHPENVGGVKDKEDIWYSELDSAGRWQLARNLGALNNAGPNFVNTIKAVTPDGKSAIMVLLGNKYLDNGKMLAGVSISTNVGGTWSKPVALNIINDYNYAEKANYFLADNRQTLLMSVEREDTQGDRDLYVTFMNSDSSWSEPLNLGDVVNTAAKSRHHSWPQMIKRYTFPPMDLADMVEMMFMSPEDWMTLGQIGQSPKTLDRKLTHRWKIYSLIFLQPANLPTTHVE